MASSYFYLRPGVFSVVGFAYGKAEGAGTRSGRVKVKLVPSGRWAEEHAESVELAEAEIAPRAVTSEEALDGVGTFVGGVICTSWVRPGGARVWDYGLVVGYKWCAELRQGLLDVKIGGVEASVVYTAHSTQDVAVEIYALQPCGGQSTSLLMAPEMKQRHAKVYNKFNGVDGAAVRDSVALLADVGGKACDEKLHLPLLDITSFEVSQVTVRHILDYVFYKEGGRSHPDGVVFGDTIFDEIEPKPSNVVAGSARTSATPSGTDVVLSDGLSDSEDDDLAGEVLGGADGPPEPKHQRRTASAVIAQDGQSQATAGSRALGHRLDPDVDQLISLQRARAVPNSSVQVVTGRGDDTVGKTQFQPSSMQTTVHLALVNGKYASFTAQQFVEFVQVHWRTFGFFPHPAVLRGLFGWDFGTRGLSIAHFNRVTELEKRERVRRSDMSNFSKKNTLSVPPEVVDFATLVGAVDVLGNVARQLYQPVVGEVLQAASTFLAELRVSELPTSAAALTEISAWIDDRLELFRVFIADEDWTQVAAIKSHFSASHESFVRVHQLILRQDIVSALKPTKSGSSRPERGNRGSSSDKRVHIPQDVRKALPKQGNKQICLRFLSAQGCRGRNGNCIIASLCHFKPANLPDIVREFIVNNYGGLATDMQ